MRRQPARKTLGTEDLDLCFDCQAIWFDASRLAAHARSGAGLFRAIDAGGRGKRRVHYRPRCAALRAAAPRTTP
jgi:hypothetical protein